MNPNIQITLGAAPVISDHIVSKTKNLIVFLIKQRFQAMAVTSLADHKVALRLYVEDSYNNPILLISTYMAFYSKEIVS